MIYRFYDWDDTLALSRKALYLSYKKVLKSYGINFTFDYFNAEIYDDATKYLKEAKFDNNEIEEIKKEKEYHYLNTYVNEIILKLPIFENKDNNKYYIITNTNADLVKKILISKQGSISPFIRIIGTYNGIPRKPKPDLYEFAFDSIKKEWDNTNDELHIYEDSVAGLLAGVKFFEHYEKRISNFTLHHIKHKNLFINI